MRLDTVLARLRNARRVAGGYTARCPAHADANPSLSVREGENGSALIYCHAGCDYRSILRALELAPERPDAAFAHLPQNPRSADRGVEIARRLWREAAPPPGTPAERYLRGRGIELQTWPPTLRYHPRCPHPSGAFAPALIAAVTVPDADEKPFRLRAAHRIFITLDGGKFRLEPRKASLGSVKGAAVYLSRPTGTLVVAEGIEDAFSVMAACQTDPRFANWSYAAAVSAGNMAALELPPCVREIVIAADNDETGRRAANAAASKFLREGKSARIAWPPIGKDFNESLLAELREREAVRRIGHDAA